jgi:hypothetical protein
MKNQFLKIALSMILVAGGAKSQAGDYDGRYTNNGYIFQNVSAIPGNLTQTNGALAGRITVINTDQRWTADTIYILNNLTFVEPPANLVIEPGTIIRGEVRTSGGSSTLDPADPGSLIICRGAKIVAQGTAESPIYFTSWGDPFVPGGINTIPLGLNGVNKSSSDITTEAANYTNANSISGAFEAHKVDAKWGGLTLLGRAPVGFGGGSTNGGNLQIAISQYNTNSPQAYTRNPTFTFTSISNVGTNALSSTAWAGSSGFNLEPLFNPVGVAGLTNTSSGTFTKFPGNFLKATVADGSRTATRTTLYNIPVYVTNIASTSNVTGNYTNIGQTLTNNDTVVVSWGEATFSNRGLQYNVPTKSGAVPFLPAYGYSGAEIALELTNSSVFSSATTPTSLTNVATTNPTAQLVLSNTYLYGVIVKAPKPSTWNGTDVPTITITGSASNNATATASISGSAVSDPRAIPLKGGIGANFIEGFQAIDGEAYGLGSAPTVDADGRPWTTLSGGIYGGTATDDNSGCVRFCRISFGGFVLSPNNEINGITYGGAGSKTVTEFVEIFNNADDDFEMFGGNNNLKYVAGIFGGDDGFDTDQSYRGKGQFMLQLQNNQNGSAATATTGRPSGNVGDNLTENDGNEDPNSIVNDVYPGTEFTYFNYTGIGLGYVVGNGASTSDRSGPNFKDNSGGKILNSVFVEAPKGAVQIQAGARFYDAAPRTSRATVAGEPTGVLAYNTWSKCGGSSASSQTNTAVGGSLFPQTSGRTSSGGSTINAASEVGKLTNGLGNIFTDAAVVNSTGSNGRLAGVNPILASGVPERSNGTDPRSSVAVDTNAATGLQNGVSADRGDFFARTTFRGAFLDFNWLKGWSLADDLGVFAANNVQVPDVTLTRNSSGVLSLSFPAAAGIKYNIELSSDNKEFQPYEVMTQASQGTITRALNRTNDVTFVRVTPL